MKTFSKIIFLQFLLIAFAVPVSSQNLFTDYFNYPVRDSLEEIGGWFKAGGNTNNNVKVVSPGLTYAGYPGSGVGNSVSMNIVTDGDVCMHSFATQPSGSLFMSFLIRVESFSPTATQGYNICLNPNSSTNFNTKTYVKNLSATTFNFGIEKLYESVKYAPTVYSTNVTYLVVVEYKIIPGASNDSAKIFVFSSGVSPTEPTVPAAFDTDRSDIPDNSYAVLTNSYAKSGLSGSIVKIDGIRVGTTWAGAVSTPVHVNLKLKGLMQGFYNNVTNKMVRDTLRVYLRQGVSPYTIADSAKAFLDSTGSATFQFSNVGNSAPYYIVAKHRNSIETWSSSWWSFYLDSLNYDYTVAVSQAFGSNMIQKGTKFCFYGGDINQDGSVSLTDQLEAYNNSNAFVTGYVRTDLNGDNITNLADVLIAYNNSINFVHLIRP